jgi:hypothetical protein
MRRKDKGNFSDEHKIERIKVKEKMAGYRENMATK